MNKRILLQTLHNRDRRTICQSILPQKTDYQITINKQFANMQRINVQFNDNFSKNFKIMSQPISFLIYYKMLDSFLWICINQPFSIPNSLAIIRPPMIRCNVQCSFSLMLVLWKPSCISWRTCAQDKLPQLRVLSVTLPLSVKVK